MHQPYPGIAELAQAGQVRIGVFQSFQYAKHPATGQPAGLAVEVARALASRLGLGDVVTIEWPTPADVITCLKERACDLGFMNFDPARACEVDFSPPFVRSDFTYLLRAAPQLRRAAEIDAPGIRIAAVRGHASTAALLRIVRRADLVHVDTCDQAFDLLQTGCAEAFASIRQILMQYAARLSGSLLLEDAYARSLAVVAVGKGHRERLASISGAIDDLKQSGLLRRIIDDLDLRGVEVVMPAAEEAPNTSEVPQA